MKLVKEFRDQESNRSGRDLGPRKLSNSSGDDLRVHAFTSFIPVQSEIGNNPSPGVQGTGVVDFFPPARVTIVGRVRPAFAAKP